MFDDLNQLCPFVIDNVNADLVTRDQTYNMCVLGFINSSNESLNQSAVSSVVSSEVSSAAETTVSTPVKITQNKLNGMFVRIKRDQAGVRLVQRGTEKDVELFHNSKTLEQADMKQKLRVATSTRTETERNRTAPNQKFSKFDSAISGKKPTLIAHQSGIVRINTQPPPLTLITNPNLQIIHRIPITDVSKTSITMACTKPAVRTVGINTDANLFERFIRDQVARVNSAVPKKTIATQINDCLEFERTDTDLDEIFKTMLLDSEYNRKLKEDKAIKEFQKELLICLKKCRVEDASGNLPLHNAVLDNDVDLVAQYVMAMKICKVDINSVNCKFQSALQLAIMGNVDIGILDVLFAVSDLEVIDSQGNNLLHLAVVYSETKVVELLMSKMAYTSANTTNYDGYTPLILSVLENNAEKTEAFLRAGVNPNICDKKSGRTALFHALEINNSDIITMLLDYNAEASIKNFCGTSPYDVVKDPDIVDESIKALFEADRRFSRSKSRRKRVRMTDSELAAFASKRVRVSMLSDVE